MSAGLWQVSLSVGFCGIFYKAPQCQGHLSFGCQDSSHSCIDRCWGPLKLWLTFSPCLGNLPHNPQRQGHHPARLSDFQNSSPKHGETAGFLTLGVWGMGDVKPPLLLSPKIYHNQAEAGCRMSGICGLQEVGRAVAVVRMQFVSREIHVEFNPQWCGAGTWWVL